MQARIVELALSWKEARMQASIMSIAHLLCTLSWKECYNTLLTSKESKFPEIVCRSFAVKDCRIFCRVLSAM